MVYDLFVKKGEKEEFVRCGTGNMEFIKRLIDVNLCMTTKELEFKIVKK